MEEKMVRKEKREWVRGYGYMRVLVQAGRSRKKRPKCVEVLNSCMWVSVLVTGVAHVFSLLCLTTLMWVRLGLTETKEARQRTGWKKWSDYREPTDMRWAPCALTQSSCPPGRTVSSRPIRSEQQGGACKVSRERAMGENVSITPWDAACRPDSYSASANSAVFDICVTVSTCVIIYLCVCVCLCVCVGGIDVWTCQRQQSRLQHKKVWPVGFMREKWAHYSHIKHCTNKEKTTNK